MKSIVITAKNVEKAIKEGLEQLNVTQDQVDIKIIDEGGLFRKAKVEITLDENEKEESNVQEQENVKKDVEKNEPKLEEQKVQEKIDDSQSNQEEKTQKSKKVYNENLDDARIVGGEFLKGLFNQLNIETIITSTMTPEGINYNVKGDRVNELIGYRGETLNALQYLLSMIIKNAGYKTKVFLDVENYKKRREETLASLAERLARKAIKLNKPIELEPMNAYERRIIHTVLGDNEFVETHSEGEEPNRHLIITPKNKD